MKRRDLEKMFARNGWWIDKVGHGSGKHIAWTNGTHTESVPKSLEIKEGTAKKIIKRCGLK